VTLPQLLQSAILDNYKRKDKTSRGYPRKKQERPPGPPRIITATSTQVRLARKLKHAQKG
jgi:hypothetical protein